MHTILLQWRFRELSIQRRGTVPEDCSYYAFRLKIYFYKLKKGNKTFCGFMRQVDELRALLAADWVSFGLIYKTGLIYRTIECTQMIF